MKLIDYITGNRKGREARRIEREAMDDPFLHDALEGYDAVPGDPGDAIRRMQRRVTGAAGKLRRRIYWRAAAALLLSAGAGGGGNPLSARIFRIFGLFFAKRAENSCAVPPNVV